MRRRFEIGLAIIALVTGLMALPAAAQAQEGSTDVPDELAGDPRFPAPDFPQGVTWLNVPAPLTLADLRGKVTLLDFWTYGCINCIHMIPTLERLEAKYGSALAVIGVHSAKFENEGQTENLRQIVERYGLKHPVINDSGFAVWNTYRRYGVNAWPTFVVIDPRGNLFAVQAGEIPFEVFDRVIGGMIAAFDAAGEIDRTPLGLALEGAGRPPGTLAFPGKVLADPASGRLFIADTNHHRLIIADLTTYEVLDVIGSGARGLADGGYAEAAFDKPQGLALAGGTLYVADTNNHAIRAVNLVERAVSTAAGTGRQGYTRSGSGPARTTDLSSPWDVAAGADGTLYIAMAGVHQIWALSADGQTVMPLVGSGREGRVDGAFDRAELAQPSGLYLAGDQLYFADSESSTIRVADLSSGQVTTLAGTPDNNLFDFGDVDGGYGASRLQHPLAVTGSPDGRLYVADTYNSKLKVLDPARREIQTLLGLGGLGGFRDGGLAEAEFDEPGGLSYADGKLYVADTNNHAIRVVDLAARTAATVTFPNPQALQIGEQVTVIGGNAAQGEQLSLPAQTVAAGAGEIVLNITLPAGYKLNPLAPFTVEWTTSGKAVQIAAADRVQRLADPALPVRVPARFTAGDDLLHGELTIYYCEAVQESLCFIDRVGVDVPVTVAADGGAPAIVIERVIVPPPTPDGGL